MEFLERKDFNYYVVVVPIMAFVTVFLLWATFAQIDETVKAQGKVIPSTQTKILQHLEGGIVSEILVAEGAHVKAGQVLYKIENQYFISQRAESEFALLANQAKQRRIKALLENKALQYPQNVQEKIPNIIDNEMSIFYEMKNKINLQIAIINEQLNQKKLQLREYEVRLENLTLEYNLAVENMKIQDELRNKKVISQEKYLQHLSSKQKLFTQLEEARYTIPAIKQEIKEYEAKIANEQSKIKAELLKEYNEVELEIQKLNESIKAHRDREARTSIVSPVNGIVNKLYYHTKGGIIKPGETVAEISPLEDELMIEAKVRASDRAFIYPGQKVSIEVTAYNFAKYGMIEGELIGISPDSTVDEVTKESFYTVRIKADRYMFDQNAPILIGMTVRVNIMSDKKTIMQYLLKPLRDIGYRAFKEY
jgi:HlyD family secretion protein/adhesin transport system membrane fusion protein